MRTHHDTGYVRVGRIARSCSIVNADHSDAETPTAVERTAPHDTVLLVIFNNARVFSLPLIFYKMLSSPRKLPFEADQLLSRNELRLLSWPT